MRDILEYDEPLFRPPSEAESLILQVTLGCSNNTCTFCEMYKSKRFLARKIEDVERDIKRAAAHRPVPAKIFLADGDAFALSADKLVKICACLRANLRGEPRISIYASPQNILAKSPKELKNIRTAGISLLYFGLESGSEIVLKKVKKGATPDQMIKGMQLAQEAGFDLSVTWILGLGGKVLSEAHARDTAAVLSRVSPKFCSALTLMLPDGGARIRRDFPEWEEITPVEALEELKIFVANYSGGDTIFRSNHASNYLAVKCTLPKDKERVLKLIEKAQGDPDNSLRPDWMRAL